MEKISLNANIEKKGVRELPEPLEGMGVSLRYYTVRVNQRA